MSTLPAIANRLFMVLNRRAYKKLTKSCRHPEQVQERLLRSILKKNRHSRFGLLHNFRNIRNYADYHHEVPLSSYDDYQDAIYQSAQGEKHLLCHDPIHYFAISSGTTAASKLIPFTASLKSEFNRAINPWIYNLLDTYKGIRGGKQFWIITPSTLPDHLPESVIPIGFEKDRDYFGKLQRFLIGTVMLLPEEIKNIRSSENYFYLISWFLLKEKNLRLISIWNPSLLLWIMHYLNTNYAALCADIAGGKIRLPKPDEPGDRKLADNYARRDVKRGEFLMSVGSASPENISLIWPRLKLISSWADAWAGELIPDLKSLFPGISIQGKGLLMTEGVISIPHTRLPDPLLTVNCQFYEFRHPGDNQTYLAHELNDGDEYEVIITTSGGFYRYKTDDIIRVKGFFRNTPMIEFIGKQNVVSDLCGEKLHENFIANILHELSHKYLNGERYMFLAPAKRENRWSYTLYLEVHPDELTPYENELCKELDMLLKKNYHYKHCRRMQQLDSPRIHFLNEESCLKSQKLRLGERPSGTKKLNYLETALINPDTL
ncbi:MAG: GH3 auxin-responsive promoter family protein [Bacteroidales bacterium]|nr:GH3 auxin-responsive promoter family protein [Bacteroidales bacterium]